MTRRILPVALAMLLAVTAFVAARFVPGDSRDGSAVRVSAQPARFENSQYWALLIPGEDVAPRELQSAPDGCDRLCNWATGRGGVPVGHTTLTVAVDAPADRLAIVERADVVRERELPQLSGAAVGCRRPTGGSQRPDHDVELTEGTNQILLAVLPGESARFGADVKLPDCSCEWRLELVIRIGEVSERIVIQDGDRPFRSASTPAPLGSDTDPEVTIGQPSSATSASDVPLSDTDLRDYPLVADRGGLPAVPVTGLAAPKLSYPAS